MTAERDPLDAVIARITRSAPPADGWPRARKRTARTVRRRRALRVLAACAAVLLVVGLGVRLAQPARVNPPEPVEVKLVDVIGMDDVPLLPPVPPPSKDAPRLGRMAGVWASPRLAVASAAPVIVSTGGAASIKLGGTVPAGTVGERVHVWNWDKSPDSRVLTATVKGAFTLTPDGATLLTTDGRAIDLATDKETPLLWWGDGPAGLKLRPSWLTFSPNGKTLLAFEHDQKLGTARLLDYPAGTERARVGGLWWAASQAAFTPDGATVVLFGSDAHLRTFDTTTGKEKVRFAPPFENTIAAIAISPDGVRVAGAHHGTVRVWDAATGKLVCEPNTKGDGPLSWVSGLTFSPNGKQLAGGGSGRLGLWDTADGTLIHRYPSESNIVGHIRFDAAGSVMTTVKDFFIWSKPDGGDVTVYPVADRWRTTAPERAGGE